MTLEKLEEIRELLERGLSKDRHKAKQYGMDEVVLHRWWRLWALDLESNVKEAIAAIAEERAKPEPGDVVPRVCGNCAHGKSTSLDDIRCYKATPYLPTGLHCLACDDWEPCGTRDNPRVDYLRRKIADVRRKIEEASS